MVNQLSRLRGTQLGKFRLQPLPVRGDEFLRLTAAEAGLLAQAEARHGYDPGHSAGVPLPASPRLSIPATATEDGVRTIHTRRLVFRSGNAVLWKKEYDADDPSFPSEQEQLVMFIRVLFGEDPDEDEDDYEDEEDYEDDEEEW